MTKKTFQNIQNKRACWAFKHVSELTKKLHEKTAQEFRSLARTIPAKVQMMGLSSTIATLYAKKGDKNSPHQSFYNLLSGWLKEQQLLKKDDDLVEEITTSNMENYRLLTNETLQFSIWVKRFAEGMIESDESQQTK